MMSQKENLSFFQMSPPKITAPKSFIGSCQYLGGTDCEAPCLLYHTWSAERTFPSVWTSRLSSPISILRFILNSFPFIHIQSTSEVQSQSRHYLCLCTSLGHHHCTNFKLFILLSVLLLTVFSTHSNTCSFQMHIISHHFPAQSISVASSHTQYTV